MTSVVVYPVQGMTTQIPKRGGYLTDTELPLRVNHNKQQDATQAVFDRTGDERDDYMFQ